MQIADILLRVRTRLRDTKFADLRFSDNELLDYATSVQDDLIFTFNANLHDMEFHLQDSDTFVLPHSVLNIIAIFINGKETQDYTFDDEKSILTIPFEILDPLDEIEIIINGSIVK